MAKFAFNGLDQISASFEQLSEISDDDKYAIVESAASFLKDCFVDKIKGWFVQRSGDLAKSVTIERQDGEDGSYAHISLKGKHSGSSTGRRHKRVKGSHRRSSGKYSGTNAEIGYILEYGSPRIQATHWMETTNEENADEVMSIMEGSWDDLLASKGL